MISGRQTLQDVQREYREERTRLQGIGQRLQASNERVVALQAARADQIARLARIRVGEPDNSPALADERITPMLEQRRATCAKLEAQKRELEEAAARAEAEREALTTAVEFASERLDAAEAVTQERLDQDETYREQRKRAQAAELTARYADEKATQSEEERAAKGSAYDRDPLFTYLWQRHYGTREYRGWGVMRWLDRKVARLAAFDTARANYARLTELPVRLREHADAMAAAVETEITALRQLDDEARTAEGVVKLEREREAAVEALERHDTTSAEAVTERQEIAERLEQLNRGEDEGYAEMLSFLASELDRDDLQKLRREALATPLPQDDIIVAQLLELEAEQERLAATITDLGEASDGSRKRLQELEEFLQRFTQKQYDTPGASFPDGNLVSTMLTQFLSGAITSAVLWRMLEGQRRGPTRRSNSTFGSGGFGRGSPWTGSNPPRSTRTPTSPRGGTRPSPAPRSAGGMKRGGFKTGGRMSRGGFKTGGRKR